MKNGVPLVIVMISLAILVAVSLFAIHNVENYYKKQAIESGCAGYNSKTGTFQWNMEKMK